MVQSQLSKNQIQEEGTRDGNGCVRIVGKIDVSRRQVWVIEKGKMKGCWEIQRQHSVGEVVWYMYGRI